VNADGLKELFAPFAPVQVKRMFGGHGVYAGLCFAIESGGESFLEVDAHSEASFSAAGSSPFIYNAKGRAMPTSYWRLPSAAYDEPEELIRWASLGLDAARRSSETKTRRGRQEAAKSKTRKAR
jgi:DNA transformation protein